MRRRPFRSGPWLALFVLPLLVACEDKKGASTSTTSAAQAPQVSDLRVRQDSGGVAGAPTQVALTFAFADPDGDVASMEVKRQDTSETMTLGLDAAGKVFGIGDVTFEFTATAPGNVGMTATLVDAGQKRSDDVPFVIGIRAPEPAPEGESEEALHPRGTAGHSLRPLAARVRTR